MGIMSVLPESVHSETAPARKSVMYAISFDLDTELLRDAYHTESYKNAYGDIRKHLNSRGFNWQQGSVYFGDETVDAVRCVIAVQELTKMFTWFSASVRDIRMLRIEDNNDLMPAIEVAK